jgi:hypothetical protein
MVNIILKYPTTKMKAMLFIALLLVLANSSLQSSQCIEKNCANEGSNCGASEDCVNVVETCAEKCEWDTDTDYNDWNCLVFCVAPAKNDLANAFVACAKRNCPQKKMLENLLRQ